MKNSYTSAKWIFTSLMLLASALTFGIVANDQGDAAWDWMDIPIVAVAILFTVLSLFFWFKSYRKENSMTSKFFLALPLILTGLHIFIYYKVQAKINLPYFIHAYNPDDAAHQYHYYFRNDGTLKTHGTYFMSDGNDFQNFTMKGDTIFLDTILPATGIQSKVYIKTKKELIPLSANGQPIDSLTKFSLED